MGHGDNRPVNQADELLHLGLNPSLEDRGLLGHAIVGNWGQVTVAKVGLVEHVGVVVKAKEVTHGFALLGVQQGLEGAACCGRGIDPFLDGTVGRVTVVVDASSPAGIDLHAIESIAANIREIRPHIVLLVQERGASVITNTVRNSIVPPRAESIAVVQTRNRRGDDTVVSEILGLIDAGLLQPGLVEGDFLVDIRVGGIVLLEMCEGVRQMGELIPVGRIPNPFRKGVEFRASSSPAVICRIGGPKVGASSQRLLPLEFSVRRGVVLNSSSIAGIPTRVGRRGRFNVAISVMAQFDKVVASRVHLGVNRRNPACNPLDVCDRNTEGSATWLVDIALEKHVIDLGIEVDSTTSGIKAAGNPVNPGMLKIVRGSTPISIKANKESHLLPSIKVVDDSSGGFPRISVSSKFGNLFGGTRIGNAGSVMPKALSTDTSAGLQAGTRESTGVGEGHQLLHALIAAATAYSTGSKLGARKDIVLNHAHAVCKLVSIELIPLVLSQGALETRRTTIVITDFSSNNNTPKVSARAAVERGKFYTSLRNK